MRAKAPLPPQPSPLPLSLPKAVPCEQKGAFVCPVVGTGRCGDGQATGPHRNSCCGAGLGCPSLGRICFCLSHSLCRIRGRLVVHGGGLALPLAVPFRAFKPLSYRASVSPQPGQPCSGSGWVTSGMDVTDTSQGWSLSTSPGAGPATDPTGLCSDPSPFLPPQAAAAGATRAPSWRQDFPENAASSGSPGTRTPRSTSSSSGAWSSSRAPSTSW